MAIIAATALTLAAVRAAPILILPLGMVVTPAAIRTVWDWHRRRARGESATAWATWRTFAFSLVYAVTAWCWPWAVAVLVLAAGSLATYGICWLLGVGDPPSKPAAYAASLVGLVVFVFQAREFCRLDDPRRSETPPRR